MRDYVNAVFVIVRSLFVVGTVFSFIFAAGIVSGVFVPQQRIGGGEWLIVAFVSFGSLLGAFFVEIIRRKVARSMEPPSDSQE